MSDNMDEPNISTALKTSDLDPVHSNIKKVLAKGEKYIKLQESELESELYSANSQKSNLSFYYSVTVFQIIIIVILGLYQIYSFRDFLLKNIS
jgi:hypothetical protein